ncbi:MAG: helix-turn-helix domain-containing protein [Piscinibacter sp.]|nr:helix-turn-helix domain-containing protein [Piscinibacter sp.]
MSDERADAPPAATAGALLRQARQAQGMHIAVLAAAIKVPQRKLEALEADRFDELPDATFTRALAQTVCRSLKIDPAPILALLPRPSGQVLEHVAEGINAPFRERAVPDQGGSDWGIPLNPTVLVPLLIVGLAAVLYFLPSGMISLPGFGPAASGAADGGGAVATPTVVAALPASAVAAVPVPVEAAPASAPAAEPAASTVVETVHSAPLAANDAASAPAALPVAGVLLLRTSAESWVEVLDGRGQVLLSRVLLPGEAVGLDGTMPMKLTIGNAGATEVSFRGRSVDLAPRTRDNVARLELK